MRRCVDRVGHRTGLALLCALCAALAGGCQSNCVPTPGKDYHVHTGPPPGSARFWSGGVETDDGFFEYLAFATSVHIGGYPMAAPTGQRVMSNTSTAPSGDIPWVFLPDG